MQFLTPSTIKLKMSGKGIENAESRSQKEIVCQASYLSKLLFSPPLFFLQIYRLGKNTKQTMANIPAGRLISL